MRDFNAIYAEAIAHHGKAELEARLSTPATARQLAAVPDDRWLAMMTRRVFQSGFVWRVIDAKWDGFEAAFHGFDVARLCLESDGFYDERLTDTRIVRNRQKILAVADNADFVYRYSDAHDGFGRFVADWPTDDIIGLWRVFKCEGGRLGGNSGPYVLRSMGKDTFLLTRDVTRKLIEMRVVDKPPTSQRNLKKTQAAFNEWAAVSGRSLAEISTVLACAVGP